MISPCGTANHPSAASTQSRHAVEMRTRSSSSAIPVSSAWVAKLEVCARSDHAPPHYSRSAGDSNDQTLAVLRSSVSPASIAHDFSRLPASGSPPFALASSW